MADHSETFDVVEIEVTQDILRRMSDDQRAMYAVLSLSISELSSMQKILRTGPQKVLANDNLDQGYISQRFYLLRLMTSKLLEVFKTLMGSSKESRTDDAELLEFRTEFVAPRMENLREHAGYPLAKTIRDKIGFHYDLSKFKEGCSPINSEQAHTFIASKGSHSQLMPYGEIAVATILGERNGEFCIDHAKLNIEKLSEFITSALSNLVEIFNCFLEAFVTSNCTRKEISLMVPPSLLGEAGVTPFPLFFKTDKPEQ